jgi:hypothetical protein
MTVVVECDQPVGIVDVEEKSRADHQQPDPEDAGKYRHEEPVAEVGDQFALAPPGLAGLQAQKCESTANTTARAIVIGTTFAIVWPIITTTSNGKLDMAASHDRKSHEYPLALKEL